MAFGKVTVEDLKNAGLDPEALNASIQAIKDGSASKEDVTKVNEALTTMQTNFTDFTTKFNEFMEKATPKPSNNNGNDGDPKPDGTIDPIEFMSDPTKGVKAIVGKETEILRLQNLKLYSDMAYDNARRNTVDFPLFDRFKADIDKQWDAVDIRFKTTPAKLIENIYKIVVAEHLSELTTEALKNNGRFNVVAGGGSGQGKQSNTPVKTAAEQLTAEELKVAANMKMTPEEYLKEKEAIRFV